jgi:hypothetical protein
VRVDHSPIQNNPLATNKQKCTIIAFITDPMMMQNEANVEVWTPPQYHRCDAVGERLPLPSPGPRTTSGTFSRVKIS